MLSGKSVGWYDAQGQGVKNDFCRFVSAGGNTWFACALAGTDPFSCSVTKNGVFSLNPVDSTKVLYPMTLKKVLSKGDTCVNGACTGLTTDGCGKHWGVLLLPATACTGLTDGCGKLLGGGPVPATACYGLCCGLLRPGLVPVPAPTCYGLGWCQCLLLPGVGLDLGLRACSMSAEIQSGTASSSPPHNDTAACYCLWCMCPLGPPQAPPPPHPP